MLVSVKADERLINPGDCQKLRTSVTCRCPDPRTQPSLGRGSYVRGHNGRGPPSAAFARVARTG